MDVEHSDADLRAQNDVLLQENNHLKLRIRLLAENALLKSRLQSYCDHRTRDEFTVFTESPSEMQIPSDEQMFVRDLQPTPSKQDCRTSSPIIFKSFLQSTAYVTDDTAELQDGQTESPFCIEDPRWLLGEIAYQLDRRILSHIFQTHKRHYGFTVCGIPEKIIEVSTHPLTGQVDKTYQRYLTQRYADLMNELSQLGYKSALHPTFSEFIVNTFGILKEKLDESNPEWADYNNPDFVRGVIVAAAPRKLQKDLLLLLDCLRNMAADDKKPLLLW